MNLTLSNFNSTAIESVVIDDNTVKLKYNSNKDKEYQYTSSDINQFVVDLVNNILNNTSVGSYIHQQRTNNNLQEIWLELIMSNKKYDYRGNSNSKQNYLADEFEDYGYDVKNVRRQSKKKVTKFKDHNDDWGDSYWTVHWSPQWHWYRVLYTSRQESHLGKLLQHQHHCSSRWYHDAQFLASWVLQYDGGIALVEW